MSVTLSQILGLIGRLDDDPGFDAPRERFRRFLNEAVVDVRTARALIEEGQRSVAEQEHYALQDVVVTLGRLLGFETTFGSYRRGIGTTKYDGHWRSRRRVHIVLDIGTGLTPRTDFDELPRSLAAVATEPPVEVDVPLLGLSIVTPLFAAREKLEDALRTDRRHHNWRIASTASLLWLADMVSAGQLRHEELVKLLIAGNGLDLVVELLNRFGSGTVSHHDTGTAVVHTGDSKPDFWIATIGRSQAATFQKMIESAVGSRHLLGVAEDAASPAMARPGDWVCFFAPGKGVVGQAQVSGVANDDAHLFRRSDGFTRLYRFKNIELFDAPIVPEADFEQTLAAGHARADAAGPYLVRVAQQKFKALTGRQPVGRRSEDVQRTPARLGSIWPQPTGRMSRSRG
jgi:hypothetical protein